MINSQLSATICSTFGYFERRTQQTSVLICAHIGICYRGIWQAFITLNFLVSGYHQYNNNNSIGHKHTHTQAKQRPIYLMAVVVLLLLLYIILYSVFVCNVLSVTHLCSLALSLSLSLLFGHFRFIHFFYTNWWLFTAFVHHMLTERTLQTRNHHSQHMHTTDSFNICFCSSFYSSSPPPALVSFEFCILVDLKNDEKITRTYIDHHFHPFETKSERKTKMMLHALKRLFYASKLAQCSFNTMKYFQSLTSCDVGKWSSIFYYCWHFVSLTLMDIKNVRELFALATRGTRMLRKLFIVPWGIQKG